MFYGDGSPKYLYIHVYNIIYVKKTTKDNKS